MSVDRHKRSKSSSVVRAATVRAVPLGDSRPTPPPRSAPSTIRRPRRSNVGDRVCITSTSVVLLNTPDHYGHTRNYSDSNDVTNNNVGDNKRVVTHEDDRCYYVRECEFYARCTPEVGANGAKLGRTCSSQQNGGRGGTHTTKCTNRCFPRSGLEEQQVCSFIGNLHI